jgi:PEP-CTERM motif
MGIIMQKKLRFGKIASVALAATAMLAATTPANAALVFNFTFLGTSNALANQAFIDAGNRWSALFTDNVTINMTVGQTALGSGILASTGSARSLYSYATTAAALTTDATSANDATAVANLAPGSSFGMLINRTADNPNGAGSAVAYVDNNGSANNSSIRMTNANAKALGLTPTAQLVGNCATACDASIAFATAFTWDYDPTDGISAGAFDFVGIATHEIGHALGFISGVDILDINSPNPTTPGPFNSDLFTFVNTLDLFRYSTLSKASGVIDWTADTRAKYFSIDGGTTALGCGFSTGRTFGDGQQASHWKDNQACGIMDPTAGQGELLAISANDIRAFDVIGWNLRQAAPAVPEPGTWMMMLAGFGLVGATARRRRSVQIAATV